LNLQFGRPHAWASLLEIADWNHVEPIAWAYGNVGSLNGLVQNEAKSGHGDSTGTEPDERCGVR
jgi:hypothetical protein